MEGYCIVSTSTMPAGNPPTPTPPTGSTAPASATPDTTAQAGPPAPDPSRPTMGRVASPRQTWPTILVEGEPEHLQPTALALCGDSRLSEVLWVDWTSGLADQWAAGTPIRVIDRIKPDNWDIQLKMVDRIATHARQCLDHTGKPIAIAIDNMTDLYAEQRRWARQQTNNVPKIKHALRQYPGLAVPIDGQLWDEIEERHIHFMHALNSVPGISVLLAAGKLRVLDSEGAAVAVPEYRIDTHRAVPQRAHAHLRVDDTGAAYARRLPPLWRDRHDPATPTTIGTVVFDTMEFDPTVATHHTGV